MEREVRQIRVYSRQKQWQLRTEICRQCWEGMFELMKDSADTVTEGLWNPIGFESRVRSK